MKKIKNLFIGCYKILVSDCNKQNNKILLIYFTTISILELLAYLDVKMCSVVASRIWLNTTFILIGIYIIYIIKRLIHDVINKEYFNILQIVTLWIFLSFFIGNLEYADINYDSTAQILDGLISFGYMDLNYTGIGFLGYPNRQYIINSLFAVLFGKNTLAIHLGFGIPFIMAITLMYYEFRNCLKRYCMNEGLAMIPCYLILSFRFIPEYYLNFEQAITPVTLTIFAIALFIRLVNKTSLINLVCITHIGCLCSNSYTPTLASLALLVCFMICYIIYLVHNNYPNTLSKFKYKIYSISYSIVTIVIFFVATIIGTREDRLERIHQDFDILKTSVESIFSLLLDKHVEFFGVFSIVVILYLIFSITGNLKVHDYIFAVWILGVVVFSKLLIGYMEYYIECWIVQRDMIIIPIIVIAISIIIFRYINRFYIDNATVELILSVLGMMIIYNFNSEHQSITFYENLTSIKFSIDTVDNVLEENHIDKESEFNLIVTCDDTYHHNDWFYISSHYYYPNAYLYSCLSDSSINRILEENPSDIFIITDMKDSLDVIEEYGVESITYHSNRYDKDYVWYYAVIPYDSNSKIY